MVFMYVWILFALVLGLTILAFVYKNVVGIFYFIFRDRINRNLVFRRLKAKYKLPIEQYSYYYQSLTDEEKVTFERRVAKFIAMKTFIARGDLEEVTPTMKALIAASAIEITYGFPFVYFKHFWRILVYPDNYYSNITQMYHQGEVNMKGFIVLSWINFVRGYADPNDGRNLALHELAHALRIENAIQNEEYDFLDFQALVKFQAIANMEMERMRNGEPSFLRDYAATNDQEFFAVTLENFFERPAELNDYNADMYRLMARMLNQDPLKVGVLKT